MSQKSSAHFSSPLSVIWISQNLTKGSFQWTSPWHLEVMIRVKKCIKIEVRIPISFKFYFHRKNEVRGIFIWIWMKVKSRLFRIPSLFMFIFVTNVYFIAWMNNLDLCLFQRKFGIWNSYKTNFFFKVNDWLGTYSYHKNNPHVCQGYAKFLKNFSVRIPR